MKETLRGTLMFTVERLLIRGAHYRFLFVVAVIGLVSVVGGMLVLLGDTDLEGPREAIWWAFLRLSDPGYLGDDEGLWRRIVSTVLTVLGYVIFLGAMVAILTQWLNDTLERFERGLTPIRMDGHVAVLGWTNRTRAICRELVMSEGRLSRWLELRGLRRLRIAILAKKVGPELVQELQDALGGRYKRGQFVLRSGNPLRPSHLARVDLAHAASIVIPGVESNAASAGSHDDAMTKTLRSIAAAHPDPETLPTCVCEIFDPRKVPVARRAYGGPVEVIASDVVIARLLGDSLRNPGLSHVYAELVTHGVGATLYVRDAEDGQTVGDVRRHTPGAILLGMVRGGAFTLATDDAARIDADDALVFVAHTYDATMPVAEAEAIPKPPADVRLPERAPMHGRLLLIGWNRRVPDLLVDLESEPADQWTVEVLSALDVESRERDMAGHGIELSRTTVTHEVGDTTLPSTIAAMQPAGYDRILLVASDWVATGYESDARTIASYLALEGALASAQQWPKVVVELADAGNTKMFDSARAEVVVSPLILSRVLAQVVLRRELRVVIDDVFGPGEKELAFVGLDHDKPLPFDEVAAAVRSQGAVAIGLRRGAMGGELVLAPPDDELVECAHADAVIVVRVSPV